MFILTALIGETLLMFLILILLYSFILVTKYTQRDDLTRFEVIILNGSKIILALDNYVFRML